MSRRTYIEETYLYAHDGYTRSKHDTINHSEAILQRFERTDSDERERNAATSARDAEAARTRDVEQQSSGGLNGQARAGADLVSQLVGGGVRAREPIRSGRRGDVAVVKKQGGLRVIRMEFDEAGRISLRPLGRRAPVSVGDS